MSATNVLSSALKSSAPKFWQFLKYRQYLIGDNGEPEISIVHKFVDPKRAALDIGVHLGFYTRHLSKFANGVIGFEPNPLSAALAKRTLSEFATIEAIALSCKDGMAKLRVPIDGAANGGEAALGTLADSNDLEGLRFAEVAVPTRRLDTMQLPPVGFVKIDVEGHEEDVLAGGEQLLQRDRPSYMIEIEERLNAGSVDRVLIYFKARTYGAFYYDGHTLKEIARFQPELQADRAHYVNNFFFVPLERPAPV